MGMFDVKVRLANLAAPSRTEEVSLLVDTGATLSWIPREVLERLGAAALSRLPFELADGTRLERDVTAVLATIDGRKAPITVAFGEPSEQPVLGVTALENLGFVIDPVGQKLVPRNLLLLRTAQPSDCGHSLREEFNRWAEAGRGEEMERDHRRIAEKTLALMDLASTDNVLDVGCGAGWLLRTLAAICPEGRVIGMDVADEMVRHARKNCADLDNVMAVPGSCDEIPWENSFFSKAISVESAYYWPDPARGVAEMFRVLRDEGSAWILINYYRDNPHCHQWGPLLAVETHLLSADQWAEMLRAAGFTDVAHRRIVDDTPAPATYSGRWFRDAAQLAAFRAEGALLVHGTKPVQQAPPAILRIL